MEKFDIDYEILNALFQDIRTHYENVLARHPVFSDDDPVHAAAIVAEEAGEIVSCANDVHWLHKNEKMALTRMECMDTIVAAMRMILAIDNGEYTK